LRDEHAEPASPCIGVCRTDATSGCCQGCKRTLPEIASWRDLSTSEKRAVLERLGALSPIGASLTEH